jgi:3-methyladenine DNA glycosylase AlkD
VTANHTRVREVLGRLERQGRARVREDMLKRYGIVAPKAYGVPVGAIQQLAKSLGRDHDLALALWSTGWYEARLLAAYVDQPEQVSSAQMDRWAKDFDNWGVCDTICFCLFDRTPHAWRKVTHWAGRRDEFVKRAAFALLASLALHDKETGDPPFLATLPLIEWAATDERNFVKKGVSWALRSIGRRSPALRAASVELARRLADSKQPAERWVGKDAVRELTKGGKAGRR